MRKCKFLLFIVAFAMVCVMGLAACGGNATSALPENVHDGTSVLQPTNPPVVKPDTGNNTDESATPPDDNKTDESATPPDDNKTDESVTPPEDNKTEENITPPDGGDGQLPETPGNPDNPTEQETPSEQEQPSESTEPEIPNEPNEPETPTEPIEPEVPEQPSEPIEPETPIGPEKPSATALKEGAIQTVVNDGDNYSFTAETEAYYAVKVAGESAVGGLIISGEKAAEGANDGFYLYEVYLLKGQTLEYTVELAGGETGVFKAAKISTVSEDGCSALSTESQKYFVFCAESDGEYMITLMPSESSEELSVGNYYLNGVCFTEDLEATFTCNLSKGQTVVIWTEQKDIGISVVSVLK